MFSCITLIALDFDKVTYIYLYTLSSNNLLEMKMES